MRSPDAPDNCPDPGLYAGHAFVAGGPTGPELEQSGRARARTAAVMMTDAVGQGVAADTGDHHSPQHFASYPRLIDAVSTTSVGDDTAAESLPGRLRPSEWDGEPGWLAAIGSGDL